MSEPEGPSGAPQASEPEGTVSDRLLSGHDALDAVLGGGLPANAISLLMGLPGTGKTIIA